MNEAKELTKLMQAITSQQKLDNDSYELDKSADFSISEILIVIGDTVCRLCLGGPQAAGLHSMIEHISAENGYSVDYCEDTVIE